MQNLNQPHITIKLTLTHSILSIRIPEVRFSVNEKIEDVKVQLERRFGTSAGCMTLVLKTQNEENISIMNTEDQTLKFYGAEDEFVIHCIDEDPNSILKSFEDTDSIEKYVMSDEDYDKLPGDLISKCQKIQGKFKKIQSRVVQKKTS